MVLQQYDRVPIFEAKKKKIHLDECNQSRKNLFKWIEN